MTAVLGVARLAISWQWLAIPWVIVALSFAVNVALSRASGDGFTTGGLTVVFVFAAIYAVQMIQQTWPFAAGLSVTRSRFYRAHLVVATGVAALSASAATVLAVVEEVTDGWGSALVFFGPAGLLVDSFAPQWAVYFAVFLLLWMLAVFTTAVGKRWGGHGLVVLLALAVLLPTGLGVLLSATGSLPALTDWALSLSAPLLFAATPLGLAALIAGGGWLVLRRAAP